MRLEKTPLFLQISASLPEIIEKCCLLSRKVFFLVFSAFSHVEMLQTFVGT